jgi:hypothetical protein
LKLSVAEYLRMEMNIKTVDSSNIVKAFTQPNKTDDECLRIYAQFDNMNSVNTIWQHVNRLGTKPDNHVMIYVPSTHQEQFAHLNTLGYPYRKPPTGLEKCSIRVRYGANNLYLQFKPISSNHWTTVNAPNLPPPKLRNENSSFSPPSGRQRQSHPDPTQKRPASSSPDHKSPKMSRTDGQEKVDTADLHANSQAGKSPVPSDANNANGSDAATDEVFDTDLSLMPAPQDPFKSIYAQRLSTSFNSAPLNSNLLT